VTRPIVSDILLTVCSVSDWTRQFEESRWLDSICKYYVLNYSLEWRFDASTFLAWDGSGLPPSCSVYVFWGNCGAILTKTARNCPDGEPKIDRLELPFKWTCDRCHSRLRKLLQGTHNSHLLLQVVTLTRTSRIISVMAVVDVGSGTQAAKACVLIPTCKDARAICSSTFSFLHSQQQRFT
jgi:hypothetical protein